MSATIVILGATGDLTARYLLPGIAQLVERDLLGEDLRLVGVANDDLDEAGFRDRVRAKLAEHAKGLERITFHELRHTAGSLQLAENATMTTVSKNLGHSSVSVTAAVYAHAYADDQREAVSAVARRLGRGGRKAEKREEGEEE